jgi:hypothetical protein
MKVSAYQAWPLADLQAFSSLLPYLFSWILQGGRLQGDPLQAFGVLVSALSPDLIEDLLHQLSTRIGRGATYLGHQ